MAFKLDELIAIGSGSVFITKTQRLGFDLYALVTLGADGKPLAVRTFFEERIAFKALNELLMRPKSAKEIEAQADKDFDKDIELFIPEVDA